MQFLDTHQHLLYREHIGYAWADEIEKLKDGDFTVANYQQLSKEHPIAGTIFMEAGANDADYQAETRFVADLVKEPTNNIRGIIASIRPETNDGFDAWLEECSTLPVVGFRRILHVVDDERSQSETFRNNVRKIGAAGKTFDICFLARQLPLAYELATACANTQLILNHCGVPDIENQQLDPWREDMRKLASLPNVVCKLSGIMAYCAPGTATLTTIKPYVEHVLEVFGPARMLWGSDWPVVNLGCGLPEWLAVSTQILQELSATEADQIASGNAQEIYGVRL